MQLFVADFEQCRTELYVIYSIDNITAWMQWLIQQNTDTTFSS